MVALPRRRFTNGWSKKAGGTEVPPVGYSILQRCSAEGIAIVIRSLGCIELDVDDSACIRLRVGILGLGFDWLIWLDGWRH